MTVANAPPPRSMTVRVSVGIPARVHPTICPTIRRFHRERQVIEFNDRDDSSRELERDLISVARNIDNFKFYSCPRHSETYTKEYILSS